MIQIEFNLINGEAKDLSTTIQNKDKIILLNFESAEGQYMFWHTSAHVLAQAILYTLMHSLL